MPNTLVNLAGAVFIAAVHAVLGHGGPARRQVREVAADPLDQALRDRHHGDRRSPASGAATSSLLFAALALLGVHSTLFGPVKYAILPQHLKPEELVGGNGLVEMGTFVAILLGTIVGGLVVAIEGERAACSRARSRSPSRSPGTLASRAIPPTPAGRSRACAQLEPVHRDLEEPRFARENRVVWLSMLGISWFWFYGATFLAQFPGFARDSSAATSMSSRSCSRCSRSASASGSLLCERLSGRKVELGLVPFGSIGLTVFAVDLWLASTQHARDEPGRLGAFFGEAGALARRRRPRADRPLRRLLHRAALRADPGALGAVAPLADHRRQQHPERAVHGRVGAGSPSRCSAPGSRSPSCSSSPRS